MLIDIQNDFLPEGSLAVNEGNEIIPIINGIQQYFDLVIATQDWHPAKHKSFASNHEGKACFEVTDLNGLPQTLWPDHCVQGSQGAEFSRELNMHKVEAIFRKGMDIEMDSYSGFYDNGHRKSTGLADYLRGKKITEVYLAGLAGDFCVYYSALDSIAEGFETFVMEDAVRAINNEDFKKAKADIISKGGKIVNSNVVKTPTVIA